MDVTAKAIGTVGLAAMKASEKGVGKKISDKAWDSYYKKETKKEQQKRDSNNSYKKELKDVVIRVAKEEIEKWQSNSSNVSKCRKSIKRIIDTLKKKYPDIDKGNDIDTQTWEFLPDLMHDENDLLEYEITDTNDKNIIRIDPLVQISYLKSEYPHDIVADILPVANKDICSAINSNEEIKELIKSKSIRSAKVVNNDHIEIYVE